jgi:GNAT superfamily N-acetyltransferase
MTSVLHFRKQLVGPPVAVFGPGILVRPLAAPEEVPAWLALRERAMADERPTVRPWTSADFEREMTGKSWWRGDHCWVAIDAEATRAERPIIGTATLSLREGAAGIVPVVHWLLVDPAWRRRGVGRLLMAHLELAAWDTGWREVQLETHAGWSAALAFYHSMGYAPLGDRSPR